MSDGKTCPICKLPSGKMGGKHYACATGRPRGTLTADAPPVVIRRDADPPRHSRRPIHSDRALERLCEALVACAHNWWLRQPKLQ